MRGSYDNAPNAHWQGPPLLHSSGLDGEEEEEQQGKRGKAATVRVADEDKNSAERRGAVVPLALIEGRVLGVVWPPSRAGAQTPNRFPAERMVSGGALSRHARRRMRADAV